MHESLHINSIQRHKKTKTGDTADDPLKTFSDSVLHVIAFEPRFDIASGLVRPALRLRTMLAQFVPVTWRIRDRKSTRLNSSHGYISYAAFCLKKKIRCLGR